jgi:hypothetical protein
MNSFPGYYPRRLICYFIPLMKPTKLSTTSERYTNKGAINIHLRYVRSASVCSVTYEKLDH